MCILVEVKKTDFDIEAIVTGIITVKKSHLQ